MRVTVDIDKHVPTLAVAVEINIPFVALTATMTPRVSAHNRVHLDYDFPDDLGYCLEEALDFLDIENMFLILFRISQGDDWRRIKGDVIRLFANKDIQHYLKDKEDYKHV